MFYGCFRRSAEWWNLANRRKEHQRFLTWATDTTHIHYKVLTLNLSLLYNPCKPPLCRFPWTFAIKQHNIGAVFFKSVVSTFLTELWMGKRMRGGKIESSFLCERVNFAGSFWLGAPRQLGNNVIHHQTVNEGIHRMAKWPDFGSFNQRILIIGKAQLIYYSYYSSLIRHASPAQCDGFKTFQESDSFGEGCRRLWDPALLKHGLHRGCEPSKMGELYQPQPALRAIQVSDSRHQSFVPLPFTQI